MKYTFTRLAMNCQDPGCPRMALFEAKRDDGWHKWICQRHRDELLEEITDEHSDINDSGDLSKWAKASVS